MSSISARLILEVPEASCCDSSVNKPSVVRPLSASGMVCALGEMGESVSCPPEILKGTPQRRQKRASGVAVAPQPGHSLGIPFVSSIREGFSEQQRAGGEM
jgi:hypothetical protein